MTGQWDEVVGSVPGQSSQGGGGRMILLGGVPVGRENQESESKEEHALNSFCI